LAQNRIVICDRYADASVAYQGGGRQLGPERVDAFNAFAIGAAVPRMTVLCLLPPEIGRSRTANREQDRLELESKGFHQRVYETYRSMADSGDRRYVVVDAQASPEEMLKQTLEYLRSLEHELLTGL
jgi:dTMP kinase